MIFFSHTLLPHVMSYLFQLLNSSSIATSLSIKQRISSIIYGFQEALVRSNRREPELLIGFHFPIPLEAYIGEQTDRLTICYLYALKQGVSVYTV